MIRLATTMILLLAAGTVLGQGKVNLPDGMELSDNPVSYVSENADFQLTFPSGCGELHSRVNEPDLFGGETYDDIVQVQYIYCDRHQEKGEGCSITSVFNWHDQEGNPAGPPQVVKRVGDTLRSFGVKVVSQREVRRSYNEEVAVEGVDVFARAAEGDGEVRVMGLLSDGDLYVLAAWNNSGGLDEDPEMTLFFDSFQPFVE
jgi:hypothetical protein